MNRFLKYFYLFVSLVMVCSCEKYEQLNTTQEVRILSTCIDSKSAAFANTTRSGRDVQDVDNFEIGDVICIEYNIRNSSSYYYFEVLENKTWSAIGEKRLMVEDIDAAAQISAHFIPGAYDIESYAWQGEGEYPDIMRDLDVELINGGLYIDFTRINGKLKVFTNSKVVIQSITLNALIRYRCYEQSESGVMWSQHYLPPAQMRKLSDVEFEINLADLPQLEIPLDVLLSDGRRLTTNTKTIEIESGKVAYLELAIPIN